MGASGSWGVRGAWISKATDSETVHCVNPGEKVCGRPTAGTTVVEALAAIAALNEAMDNALAATWTTTASVIQGETGVITTGVFAIVRRSFVVDGMTMSKLRTFSVVPGRRSSFWSSRAN